MDSVQLYRFKCIAEYGSISKAAEALFISQPTLSMMLRDLEEELTCTLFERKGHRLEITADGKKLLAVANTISDMITSTEQEFQSAVSSNLTIYSCDFFFHALLPSFTENIPDNLFLNVVPNKSIPSLMSGNHYISAICDDFYLKSAKVGAENVIRRFLFQEDLYLSVRRDHPWAGRKTMDVTEIGSEPLFCYSSNSGFSEWVDDMAAANNIKLHYALALDSAMSSMYQDAIPYPRFFSSRVSWDQNSIPVEKDSFIKLTGEYTQRDICLWYPKKLYPHFKTIFDYACARAVELNNCIICFNEGIYLPGHDLKVKHYLS